MSYGRRISRIECGDEFLDVDLENLNDLEAAMKFKAQHIKARAEPELFTAVADALSDLRCAIREMDDEMSLMEMRIEEEGRCNDNRS